MVTNQEYEIIGQFFLDHGIETDGPAGEKNGKFFGVVLTSPVTQEKLQAAFEKIKHELVFVDPIKAEYNRVVSQFSEYDRDFIAAKLGLWGYEGTDLQTWTLTAKAFVARGYQVTSDNFNIVIGNLAAGPQGHLLRTKPQQPTRKFDAEAAVEEQRKAPKITPDESQLTQKAGDHPQSWSRPLDGVLKEHQRMLQRPLQPGDAGYEDAKAREQVDRREVSAWETMTLRRLQHDVNTVDRLEAEETIISLARSRQIEWREAYYKLENFIIKRHADKLVAATAAQNVRR